MMEFKYIVAFTLSLLAFNSQADCWVVGELHGMTAIKDDSYRFTEDAFTGRTFQIIAEKDHSSVTGSDLNYVGLNRKSVLGTFLAGHGRTVETWNISDDDKVVFYTLTRTGFSDALDGTKSFVGKVLNKCN